jgi:hypothetical protein
MRSFQNLKKTENGELSERFSFLLKYNEDCTKEDCSWAAITIFDHWLYESDSFDLIEGASLGTKASWTSNIKHFLHQLAQIETPLKYRYRGRNSKQRLQFASYTGTGDSGDYLSELFDRTYHPNVVFPELGIDLWFEDNWTLHFKYKSHSEAISLFKLVAYCGLYVLPAYCSEHLNDYDELSAFLLKSDLGKVIYRNPVG